MLVQDLMSSPVVTCHVNDTLNTAAQRMWDQDCGAIAVVDDAGALAGIVTDRDVCMAAYTQGKRLDEIAVRGVMARQLVTTRPDHKLGEVEKLMADHQIRRIPVLDGEQRPIGMVTLNDLAVESAQPDTKMKGGPSKIAHTLAAICQARVERRRAA